MIAPASPQLDALEQRDIWRTLWQALTSDILTALLCGVLLLLGVASLTLPQAPPAGAADPVAYSEWQAAAQSQAGPAYTILETLGLFNLAQAWWTRVLMWGLAGALLARLADRVARLVSARRADGRLQDETRLRVTDQAAPLPELAAMLRARRYRVTTPPPDAPDDWIRADRAPWADLASVALHVGLLLALAGAMMNSLWGWSASRLPVNASRPLQLPEGSILPPIELVAVSRPDNSAVVRFGATGEPVTLTQGASVPAPAAPGNFLSCCLRLQLTELAAEYQVAARRADGAPLTITLSSYAMPATEALLTFRPGETERSFALGDASVGVIVSSRDTGERDRARVFTIPSGEVLTDTVIQPSLTISAPAGLMTMTFDARDGAVIAARYQPGVPFLGAGAALALAGLIGAVFYPAQYLLIRRHDVWTEFYASGRRTRALVRALSRSQLPDSRPNTHSATHNTPGTHEPLR